LFWGLKIKRKLNTDDEVTSQNSDGDPMPDVIKARENGECCHPVIFQKKINFHKQYILYFFLIDDTAWPKAI
jgi:hypothetical protein